MKQLALDIALVTGPTLDNFFAGPNEAALRHLRLWAGSAGSSPAAVRRSPVPIYLWGGPASGKTHLLRAVQGVLLNQDASVGWLDSTVLEPPPFQETWSVVLIDDVQLFTAAQQHAAFNWFVNAQSHQCGVLAAGELPPADLRLREDLRTRLGWGHVFQLQALTEGQRRGVLRQEADARGLVLGDEVMDFILARFARDLGSLMQLLDQLDAYALQSKRAITVPMVKAMMESQ